MIMLISLTQNRMDVGRVTLHCKGPMRGQYVFLLANSQSFIYVCNFVFSSTSSGDSVPYFIEMIRLVVWKVP